MQQLQAAPEAAQEAPRGRSGYSWCLSRCEVILSTVLSSLTLVMMLLSHFHVEKEQILLDTHVRCFAVWYFYCFIFTGQFITTSLLLLSPKLPLASGHIKGPNGSKLPDEKHIFIFTSSGRQRKTTADFPAEENVLLALQKSNMLLQASKFTCPSHSHQWAAPKYSLLLFLNRTTQFSPNLGRCHSGVDIK